jgi:hypothetical protein
MSSPAEISLMQECKALVLCERLETIVNMGVKIISCFGRLLTEKIYYPGMAVSTMFFLPVWKQLCC